jgi:sec-independent protein translocase protein TatA
MFGLGAQELFVIFIIVLIIFGGKRLPEIGSALGKSIREFKKATHKEKDEVSTWINPPKGGQENQKNSAAAPGPEQKSGLLENEIGKIPGVKEAQQIKDTASKIKAAGRMFLKK